LNEQNHTSIALVPKQLGPFSITHFKPISVSKILANRFKRLLHHFISQYQYAFVSSRNIEDNSILAHELIHTLKFKKGRGGLMEVEIDMEKTFDQMEWNFHLSIMSKLRFHPVWINWIRICITSIYLSIMINSSKVLKLLGSAILFLIFSLLMILLSPQEQHLLRLLLLYFSFQNSLKFIKNNYLKTIKIIKKN
jgi:hypothetical protein